VDDSTGLHRGDPVAQQEEQTGAPQVPAVDRHDVPRTGHGVRVARNVTGDVVDNGAEAVETLRSRAINLQTSTMRWLKD